MLVRSYVYGGHTFNYLLDKAPVKHSDGDMGDETWSLKIVPKLTRMTEVGDQARFL